MERGTAAGQHVVLDSPIGRLVLVVTARGLRKVHLPRPAHRYPDARAGQPDATAARPRRGRPAAQPLPGELAANGSAARAAGQIMEYLRGARREFELPLDLTGIGTQTRTVLDELCARAPYGKMITYGELATWSSCPGGAQAVGQIMARNPIPLVIPCHRVVAAGDLGGYGGGLSLKRWLLRIEGALTEQLDLLGEL